jgi:hypothetical protein
MLRPGGNLPPAMASQEPRARRLMPRRVHLGVQSPCDPTPGRHLASRCTREKGLDDSWRFCHGHRVLAAPTGAWGIEGPWSHPVISRENLRDKRNGDAKRPCHRWRWSWIDQRGIHHAPFLGRPESDGGASFPVHFRTGQVRRRAGTCAQSFLLIPGWGSAPLFYLTQR